MGRSSISEESRVWAVDLSFMPTSINPQTLKKWLDSKENVQVVDVRDDDHLGGHVSSSINVPSLSFAKQLPNLKADLEAHEKVVFYCQLSQQRGPSCAALYERNAPSDQEIYVLDGGFQNWAYSFGNDKTVTEKFMPDLYP